MTFDNYFQEVLETLSVLGYNDEGGLEKDAKKAFKSQILAYDFAESAMSDKGWFEKPIIQVMSRVYGGNIQSISTHPVYPLLHNDNTDTFIIDVKPKP